MAALLCVRCRPRFCVQWLAATRITPPLTPGADEPTVTYMAPSGPWAIPPGSASCPAPIRVCELGWRNGILTTSPGGFAWSPPWNISVAQKLPERSNVQAVTVVRPDVHTWGAVG